MNHYSKIAGLVRHRPLCVGARLAEEVATATHKETEGKILKDLSVLEKYCEDRQAYNDRQAGRTSDSDATMFLICVDHFCSGAGCLSSYVFFDFPMPECLSLIGRAAWM